MNLFNYIKEGFRRMLDISKIKQVTQIEGIDDSVMHGAMDKWYNIYTENAPWLYDKVNRTMKPSTGAAATCCSELSRLMLLEFDVKELGKSGKAQLIHDTIQSYLPRLSDDLEEALAVGGMFLKPSVTQAGKLTINAVSQQHVHILATDENNVPTTVIFPEQLTKGEVVYTKLEVHRLDGNVLHINNYAFIGDGRSNPLKQSIELTKVPEWEMLAPEAVYGNISSPLYGYFKVAMKNTTDTNSPLGASIFARADKLIREADIQLGRLLWEYEATEAAVHVPDSAFKPIVDRYGNATSRMPEGKERLYRTYKQDLGENAKPGGIDIYSPQIRDTAIVNGLNQLYMQIENVVGLARGTLSNDKMSDSYTNELELKLARNKAENTVHVNQKHLAFAMEQLIVALDIIADVYKIAPGEIGDISQAIVYGDSIVIDDVSRLESMRQDVNDGLLPKWKYIAAKYKLSEEEAKELASELMTGAPEGMLFN